MKDPKKVANQVLNAFQDKDIDTLFSLFNQANKKKFGLILTDETREKILTRVESELEHMGDSREVKELRKAPPFVGEGAVVAKVCEREGRVVSVLLTKEGEDYLFEDTSSSKLRKYEKLESF
jgi:ribosomal protein RSM22 (predicted rRNA methylase)